MRNVNKKVLPYPRDILDTEDAVTYVIQLWTSLSDIPYPGYESTHEIMELQAMGFKGATRHYLIEEVMCFLQADSLGPERLNNQRGWGRCTIQ